MCPERDAAPPGGGRDGADDEPCGLGAANSDVIANCDPDDVTADAHAARALRTIGREVGMVHISDGIGALIDEWSAGAA